MPYPDLIVLESKRVNSSSTSFTCCWSQCQRTVPGCVRHCLGGLFSCLSCIKNILVKTFYFSIFVYNMLCLYFWRLWKTFKCFLTTIFLTSLSFVDHFVLEILLPRFFTQKGFEQWSPHKFQSLMQCRKLAQLKL